jgi:hypothetical protein
MKTIVFSNDPKIIKQYGNEVIVAKDPIKTLRAMKKLGSKEEYKVVGETKFVEYAVKLGFNKPEPKTEPSVQTIGKLAALYEQQLKDKEDEFKNKANEYDKKIVELKNEQDKKINELEKEKGLIKKTIKHILNETN